MAVIIDLADSIVAFKESTKKARGLAISDKEIYEIVCLQVYDLAEYINQIENDDDMLELVYESVNDMHRDCTEEATSAEEQFHADVYRDLAIAMAQFCPLDIVYLNQVRQVGHLFVVETKDVKTQPEEIS